VAKSSFDLRGKADDLKMQSTMLGGAQPASGDIKRALYGRSTWSFQVDGKLRAQPIRALQLASWRWSS